MERFYVPKENIIENSAYILGEEFNHLSKVMRLRIGDHCEIFDGEGRGFVSTISEIDKDKATVSLDSSLPFDRESDIKTYLLQGIPKGDKMELIIQKCTELGITGIVPVALTRSVAKIDKGEKEEKKLARWQAIGIFACGQCGRTRLPQIKAPSSLKQALDHINPGDLFVVPYELGGKSLNMVLSEMPLDQKRSLISGKTAIYFLIGPEGGITKEEMALCLDKGGIPITLGPRILRTETAGIMMETMLQYSLGDLAEEPSKHFFCEDSDQ